MAINRLTIGERQPNLRPGKPVAFVCDLPLMHDEALAYMAYDAGVATPQQHALLAAWRVKMILAHGTWVAETIRFQQA